VIKNFQVIFGPGGVSVGGWTIHRRGDECCLDPREVSALPYSLLMELRRNGELMAQGELKPRSKWWAVMDEELVFYQGRLLALSIAQALAVSHQQEREKRSQELQQELEKQAQQQQEREKEEQAERERREKYREEQRVARLDRERKRRDQRRGFSGMEWNRMALSESCFLELLSGTSPTDWLLSRLSDRDFYRVKVPLRKPAHSRWARTPPLARPIIIRSGVHGTRLAMVFCWYPHAELTLRFKLLLFFACNNRQLSSNLRPVLSVVSGAGLRGEKNLMS
jgi:hypothetical protein